MKLDADEKQLLESFERGEWKSTGGGKGERFVVYRRVGFGFVQNQLLFIRAAFPPRID